MIRAIGDADHWFKEILLKNNVRKETPLRPTAKHLQNEFVRAVKNHGLPEVSGSALSLTPNVLVHAKARYDAFLQSFLDGGTSPPNGHGLHQLMYVSGAQARRIPTFDALYTPQDNNLPHSDLVLKGSLENAQLLGAIASPKVVIGPFIELAKVFVACEATNVAQLEALRCTA